MVQASVERYSSEACLVYIDLDSFKAINDTYGHSAGDHVLHEYSQRLVDSVRESDIVGRLGGDEFGLILSHTNQDAAAVLVNRLHQELKDNPISWNEVHLNVSMSFGIVKIEPSVDVQDTMAMADSKMYQQKRSVKKN
ncbi:MAG: GGDEF domain-containing protein [Proteobacteria bacterium]|nr:GGDEF domain-containing protein [Pseudomonadota bacterium]